MQQHPETILVALDLNARGNEVTLGAQQATRQAIVLGKARGACLRFMHSVYSDDYRTPLSGSPGVVHQGLPEAGEQALAEMLTLARNAGLETELVITDDRPWLDITKMAVRGEVEWVLVGKRNQPAEDGRRLGSTASKLLRKCPCPVWLVRPEHELQHQNLMAASDLTPVGDRAVELACELSRVLECQLHVVHAWQMPFELQLSAARISKAEYEEEVRALEAKIRAHLEACCSRAQCQDAKIHYAKGTPSQVIGAAVEKWNPDLLVMGSISSTGIAGMLLGSTAERMLNAVDCDLLVIKPEDFHSPVQG